MKSGCLLSFCFEKKMSFFSVIFLRVSKASWPQQAFSLPQVFSLPQAFSLPHFFSLPQVFSLPQAFRFCRFFSLPQAFFHRFFRFLRLFFAGSTGFSVLSGSFWVVEGFSTIGSAAAAFSLSAASVLFASSSASTASLVVSSFADIFCIGRTACTSTANCPALSVSRRRNFPGEGGWLKIIQCTSIIIINNNNNNKNCSTAAFL